MIPPEVMARVDPELPPLAARRGIGLGSVIAFIVAAGLAIVIAIVVALR